MVLEQVLPERHLGGELGRAQVAADGVLGVRVHQPHVVLQAGDVGVVLAAVGALSVPGAGRRRAGHGGGGGGTRGGRGRGQVEELVGRGRRGGGGGEGGRVNN